MHGRPLVSVIVPTYNRAGTIVRAIDSILGQGYGEVDVIIVDDGSRDDTEGVVRRAYSLDGRVRYIRKENGGVCTARNAGLREVRGKYVAMLDSDDYWLPGKLGLQVAILERNPEVGLLWTDMDAIDEGGNIVGRRYLRSYYGAYRHYPRYADLFGSGPNTEEDVEWYSGDLAQKLLLGNMIHTSTVVARADRLASAGEYDQSVHPSEDQDFYYRVCRGGPVGFVDTVTIHYQVGAADAATARSRYYEVATSSLAVYERILSFEKERLAIDPGIVRGQLAEIYAEIGESAFLRGYMGEARRYLARRLGMRPGDLRSAAYLAMSLLPYPHRLLEGARALRGRIRDRSLSRRRAG